MLKNVTRRDLEMAKRGGTSNIEKMENVGDKTSIRHSFFDSNMTWDDYNGNDFLKVDNADIHAGDVDVVSGYGELLRELSSVD